MASTFKTWQEKRKRNPRLWFSFVMFGVLGLDEPARRLVGLLLNERLDHSILNRTGTAPLAGNNDEWMINTEPESTGIADFAQAVVRHLDTKQVRAVNRVLNTILREMCSDDAFGTEGQHDPRGDHRS